VIVPSVFMLERKSASNVFLKVCQNFLDKLEKA
jgi:hypothetical protein